MNRHFKNRWNVNGQWASYSKYTKSQKITRKKLQELRKSLEELKDYEEQRRRRDSGL